MDYQNKRTKGMDKKIISTINKYIDLVRKEFSDIEQVYLFGSYATGKTTDDSDIDIALIFEHLDDSNRFDVQVQLMLLAAQIDTRIEPHPFSRNHFNSANPFVIEIKRTGIEVAA